MSSNSNTNIDSYNDKVYECRVEGIFEKKVDQSRFFQKFVASIEEYVPKQKKKNKTDDEDDDDVDKDDDNDDGSQAEEDADGDNDDGDDGDKKKRKRKRKRIAKNRVTILASNMLPLLHVGAQARLLLRPKRDANNTQQQWLLECKEYQAVDCRQYRPAADLTFSAIRLSVCDPSLLIVTRDERRAGQQELIASGLVRPVHGHVVDKTRDTLMPKRARELLTQLGAPLDYAPTLSTLQSPFALMEDQKFAAKLQISLSGFYALQAAPLTNVGVRAVAYCHLITPNIVRTSVGILTRAPYFARANFIEQLTVRTLLQCAAVRDYIDAMTSAPPRNPSVTCGNDFVFGEWQLAKPEQNDFVNAAMLPQLIGRLPPTASLQFLWAAMVWLQSVKTNYGATLFECGETTDVIDEARRFAEEQAKKNSVQKVVKKKVKKPATDDDDDDRGAIMAEDDDDDGGEMSDDLLAMTSTAAAPVVPLSRTHWLSSPQIDCIRAAHADCWLRRATTPLYSTVAAARTADAIVDVVREFADRLTLYTIHAAGFGLRASLGASMLNSPVYDEVIESQLPEPNPVLPSVVVVYRSVWHRHRFNNRLHKSRQPARYSLVTTTLDRLFEEYDDTWEVRMLLGVATRVVLVDAHLLCEHDMERFLVMMRSAASLLQRRTELVLCGDVDAPTPHAHRESGAPFYAMWRAGVLRTIDLETSRAAPEITDARESPLVRAQYAAALCHANNAIVRAHSIYDHLFECEGVVWQVVGKRQRSALSEACTVLADYLGKHLAKPAIALSPERARVAESVVGALKEFAKKPAGLKYNFLLCAPFVRYESLIVRVDVAYVLNSECHRYDRVLLHLLQQRHDRPSVSLDTPNLYLLLDPCYAKIAGAHDHRRCCLTDKFNLMCVARHRDRLSAASITMARDSTRIDFITHQTVLVLLPSTTGAFFGADSTACQLLGGHIRSSLETSGGAGAGGAGGMPRVLMAHANPAQTALTIKELTVNLKHFNWPPPTMLTTLLQIAFNKKVDKSGRGGEEEITHFDIDEDTWTE